MPNVSVIIPVYNTEHYLRRCLDSVINQTLTDIEIICINDGSLDESSEILHEYALKDSRIKLIEFEKNKGPSAARNAGLDVATAEYVGFMDSDDWVDLNFYEVLYTNAYETQHDVIKGNIIRYNETTQKYEIEDWNDLNKKMLDHKAFFYCAFTSAIYNRRFLKENAIYFPENLRLFEDPLFPIKASLKCNEISVVNNVFYYYRKNNKIYNPASRIEKTFSEFTCTSDGVNDIIYLLNMSNCDKEHYLIVFDFCFKQLLRFANYTFFKKNHYESISKSIFKLYESCQYKQECITFHFYKKHQATMHNHIKDIRKNFFLKFNK